MPAATRPAKGRTLSVERILDAAAESVNDDGAAFSMRRVADRLGVTTMALYKWFDDRDDLLDALAQHLLRDVSIEAPQGGSWEDRVVAVATSIRAVLGAHRPLMRMDGGGRRVASLMFRRSDEVLAVMVEAGLDDDAAVDAFRILFWTTVDFCLVIDATDAMPAANGDAAIRESLAAAGVEDLSEVPTLARLADRFGPVDVDAFFERTIRVIARGLVAGTR